jgi:hypothetical protein
MNGLAAGDCARIGNEARDRPTIIATRRKRIRPDPETRSGIDDLLQLTDFIPVSRSPRRDTFTRMPAIIENPEGHGG